MKNTKLRAARAIGRVFSAVVIGTSLVAGLAGLPTPAAADQVIVRDHGSKDAWLEVVVNKIIIHDDEDGFLMGAGEFRFQVVIGSLDNCPDALIWAGCFQQLVKSDSINFSADSGKTVTLNRVVPRMGDLLSTSLDDDAGVTVHPGSRYGIEISGSEQDDFTSNDAMGWTHLVLAEDSDWSIGTHTLRGRVPRGFSFGGLIDSITCEVVDCGNQSSWVPAHYSVELEVRRVALADLTPKALKIVRRETERPPEQFREICLTVANIGPEPGGGYDVSFTIDGAPGPTGAAGFTYPGESDEVCARVPEPTLGEHALRAVISGIPEMDLSNNEMTSTYRRTVADDIRVPLDSVGVLAPAEETGPGASNPAGPGPNQVGRGPVILATSAELAVTAIQVKANNATSRTDCDPGRNDVQVTVKNQGTASASNLVVRLTVDDDEPKEKSLPSLDAGKDASVQFDELQLRNGEHKLIATVAPKDATGDRPELKVTVNCQDE